MKITNVVTHVVIVHPSLEWVFVELETDEGVTGLGECSDYGSAELLVAGIESIKPAIVGMDPRNIEDTWQRLFHRYSDLNGRGFVSHLISAIDIALWDIKGKVLGVPIHELLGGAVRETVPLYTHVPGPGSCVSIGQMMALAREAKAQGYEALKTDPFPSQIDPDSPYDGPLMVGRLDAHAIGVAVEWMDALREATGPDFELLVDAHARFDTMSAIAGAQALELLELNHDVIARHLVDRDDPVTMWGRWRSLYQGLPGGSPPMTAQSTGRGASDGSIDKSRTGGLG